MSINNQGMTRGQDGYWFSFDYHLGEDGRLFSVLHFSHEGPDRQTYFDAFNEDQKIYSEVRP